MAYYGSVSSKDLKVFLSNTQGGSETPGYPLSVKIPPDPLIDPPSGSASLVMILLVGAMFETSPHSQTIVVHVSLNM